MTRLALRLALSVLLATASAAAFRTAGDTADFEGTERVRWQSDTIGYAVVAGAPSDLPIDDVTRVVSQALATWSAPACSSVEFASSGITTRDAEPNDSQNSIAWLQSGWADRGFASDAAAITDLAYERNAEGEWAIVEGDIYLNADNHAWVLEGKPPAGARDLLSVLTHEAGHLLGMLHPCEPDGGAEAPACEDNAAFKVATMYPFYDPDQADLSADDSAGVCFLYGGGSCGVNGCGAGSVCRPAGCLAECGKKLCKPSERCSLDGCVALDACVGEGCKKCALDAACPAKTHCGPQGYCLGAALDGDPCTSDGACQGGSCSADGFCESLCSSNEDCPSDYQCQLGTSELGRCSGSKKALGEACTDPTECLGGVCLQGAAAEPLCSRACGLENAYCPEGWDCHAVENTAVCRPLALDANAAARCGVSALGRDQGGQRTLGVSAWILGATLLLRRRARRSTPYVN